MQTFVVRLTKMKRLMLLGIVLVVLMSVMVLGDTVSTDVKTPTSLEAGKEYQLEAGKTYQVKFPGDTTPKEIAIPAGSSVASSYVISQGNRLLPSASASALNGVQMYDGSRVATANFPALFNPPPYSGTASGTGASGSALTGYDYSSGSAREVAIPLLNVANGGEVVDTKKVVKDGNTFILTDSGKIVTVTNDGKHKISTKVPGDLTSIDEEVNPDSSFYQDIPSDIPIDTLLHAKKVDYDASTKTLTYSLSEGVTERVKDGTIIQTQNNKEQVVGYYLGGQRLEVKSQEHGSDQVVFTSANTKDIEGLDGSDTFTVTKKSDGGIDYLEADGKKVTFDDKGVHVVDGEKETTTLVTPDSRTVSVKKKGTLDESYLEKKNKDGKWYKAEEQAISDNGVESGTKIFDENGNLYGWRSVDGNTEISYKIDDKSCKGGADKTGCYAVTKGSLTGTIPDEFYNAIHDQQLFNGELGWQKVTQVIFSHEIGGYQLGGALFGKNDYNAWVQSVDEYFSRNYLGIEPFASAICSKSFDLDPIEAAGDNVALIETPTGDHQLVGHIEGERIAVGALTCQPNKDETTAAEIPLVCPNGLECHEDQFCYEVGKDKPADGFLYRISWGVRAPYDESYLNGGRVEGKTGSSLSFNVEIKPQGDSSHFLFADQNGQATPYTIKLTKGESSESLVPPLIVDYSNKIIDQVCIRWGDAPQTLDKGTISPTNDGRKSVKDICKDIKIATLESTRSEAVGGSTSTAAQQNQIRFCGLNGC